MSKVYEDLTLCEDETHGNKLQLSQSIADPDKFIISVIQPDGNGYCVKVDRVGLYPIISRLNRVYVTTDPNYIEDDDLPF